jgi:hypothetical protein
VRCSRRSPDETLLVKAERALETFHGRGGPHAALALGLEASVFAGLGEGDRAMASAERALALDPGSVDALAALVEVYGRMTRDAEARQDWKRLLYLAPDEAEALANRLPQLRLNTIAPRVQAGSYEPWDPAETGIFEGRRARAIETVEKMAEEYVGRMSKSASQSGLTAMATVASTCLTRAPVLSAFTPFDLSLFSIERVEAALDALYGREPRPRLRTDEGSLRLLVGSYVGESIRLARTGRWEGRVAELQKAKVIVGEQYWYPFQAVSARIHSGGRSRLVDGLRGALELRGAAPWKSHIPNPIVPPIPWGPGTWPDPADIARLGRSVMRSPIAIFAEQTGHGVLDLSLPSLGGIDAYLELICPVGAPTQPDSAWTARIATFVGAYVGEVLRESIGGEWTTAAESDGAAEFVLVLQGRMEARPIERILQRLTGLHYEPTTDYVTACSRRVNRAVDPR